MLAYSLSFRQNLGAREMIDIHKNSYSAEGARSGYLSLYAERFSNTQVDTSPCHVPICARDEAVGITSQFQGFHELITTESPTITRSILGTIWVNYLGDKDQLKYSDMVDEDGLTEHISLFSFHLCPTSIVQLRKPLPEDAV